jgi:hypothetical protein
LLGISQNPFLLPQITHLRSSSINLPERIFWIFWNSLSLFYKHNLISRFLDVSKISFGDLSNPTKGSTVAWPHRPLACTRLHTLLLDHVPTSAPFRRSGAVRPGWNQKQPVNWTSLSILSRRLFVVVFFFTAIQGITCPSYAAELLSSTASAAGCPYTGLAPCAATITVAALHRRSRRCQGPRRDRCRPSLIAFICTWLQSGRPVDCRGCCLPCTDGEHLAYVLISYVYFTSLPCCPPCICMHVNHVRPGPFLVSHQSLLAL